MLRVIKNILVAVLAITYIGGLFVPIMNNNAAHHANIALHMYLTGDYINLIDRGMDYLDKPHLLFWLAALSYKIFGVSSFSYKLFSFLFALVGIYATYRLGKILFGERAAKYAALMLSSAFAFVLSVNDVRMDAMVVSCIAFATWQLFEYLFFQKRSAIFLAALGLALGFATKGMVAVVLPVMTAFFYFIEQKKPRQIVTKKWVWLGLLTAFFLIPVFYSFYLQFDLHPEKTVRGISGNSGIKFLLFGQSIQRYTGAGWGERSSDPFYLLHTFLWAFLPWSILAFVALIANIKNWFRHKFDMQKTTAFALTATTLIIFVLVSFSRFKNAHYINILFPYFSLITAKHLITIHPKFYKPVFGLQVSLSLLLLIFAIVLNTWFFPVSSFIVGFVSIFILFAFVFILLKNNSDLLSTSVWLSFTASVFVFFLLNFNFYPKLLPYQSGHVLAQKIKQSGIDVSKIYYLDTNERNYSMDFSLHTLPTTINSNDLNSLKTPIYIFADSSQTRILQNQNINFDTLINVNHYNVSTLKFKFLNPRTRKETLAEHYILQLGVNN